MLILDATVYTTETAGMMGPPSQEGTQQLPIKESRTVNERKRGRSKITWNNTIRKMLKKKEMSQMEAKQLARDRNEWNKFIKNKFA